MAFEEYEKTDGRGLRIEEPRITIQKVGRFGLNQAAFDFLGDWVALLFDSDKQQIGFRRTTVEDVHAHHVFSRLKDETRVTASLPARQFCRTYDIPYEDHVRQYSVQESEGMLILQL
jgi:hypothetical protein